MGFILGNCQLLTLFLNPKFNKEHKQAHADFKMTILLQRDMEIDPADRVDNLDDKSEKLGRNFHNIGHHPAMVRIWNI